MKFYHWGSAMAEMHKLFQRRPKELAPVRYKEVVMDEIEYYEDVIRENTEYYESEMTEVYR